MTTINEFRDARDSSGNSESDVRSVSAHCRGFGSGAHWTADRIAGAAEALKRSVDLGLVEPSDALVNLAKYSRNQQELAASRNPARQRPAHSPGRRTP